MTDFTITQVDFDRLLDQNDEEQAVRLFCFEQLLYRWADRLSCEYQGGLWLGMTLSNGGFYAYPATSQNWSVSAENYYQGTMDSDTFGFTLSASWRTALKPMRTSKPIMRCAITP